MDADGLVDTDCVGVVDELIEADCVTVGTEEIVVVINELPVLEPGAENVIDDDGESDCVLRPDLVDDASEVIVGCREDDGVWVSLTVSVELWDSDEDPVPELLSVGCSVREGVCVVERDGTGELLGFGVAVGFAE